MVFHPDPDKQPIVGRWKKQSDGVKTSAHEPGWLTLRSGRKCTKYLLAGTDWHWGEEEYSLRRFACWGISCLKKRGYGSRCEGSREGGEGRTQAAEDIMERNKVNWTELALSKTLNLECVLSVYFVCLQVNFCYSLLRRTSVVWTNCSYQLRWIIFSVAWQVSCYHTGSTESFLLRKFCRSQFH